MPSMTLPSADAEIDCGGLLLPGFIGVHAHGRSGVDFTDPDPSAIVTMIRDKRKDGVTSLLVTALTLSFEELEVCCKNSRDEQSRCRWAKILGMHLEGPTSIQLRQEPKTPTSCATRISSGHGVERDLPVEKSPSLPNSQGRWFAQRLRARESCLASAIAKPITKRAGSTAKRRARLQSLLQYDYSNAPRLWSS